MRRPCRALAAVAPVALALVACGTTVPLDPYGAPVTGGGSDELGVPSGTGTAPASDQRFGVPDGTTASGGLPGDQSSTTAEDSSIPAAGAGSGTTGSGGTAPGTGEQSGVAGGTGRGVTASEIRIGFLIEPGASTVGKSLGAESLVGGDHEAEVNAIVADLNKRGGVLGRKIKPVFVEVDAAQEQSNPSAAAQAACSALTDDEKVFAAISYIANVNNDTMFECMARKQTAFFGTDLAPHTEKSYATRAPYIYGPHTLSVDRLAPALVGRLKAQGYFTGWDSAAGRPSTTAPVKVGVIYTEGADTYIDGIRRGLAAAGIRDIETFQHGPTNQETSSGMSAAVLQFRSAGVTHILMETAGPVLFFLPTAENQGYRPRYGFSSLNGPAALQETGALPPRQFVGSMGAGSSPLTDVGNQPGDLSPAQAACRKIMKDAGQDMSSATAFLYMVIACDGFNLIKAALERSEVPNAAGLRRGMEALGTSFVSATIPAMAWGPSRYDAVAALRDFLYRDGRFVYVGGLHRV